MAHRTSKQIIKQNNIQKDWDKTSWHWPHLLLTFPGNPTSSASLPAPSVWRFEHWVSCSIKGFKYLSSRRDLSCFSIVPHISFLLFVIYFFRSSGKFSQFPERHAFPNRRYHEVDGESSPHCSYLPLCLATFSVSHFQLELGWLQLPAVGSHDALLHLSKQSFGM